MPGHLISETALIAAEDAYDEIATHPCEQINRRAVEAAIKAYLATDPALADAVGRAPRPPVIDGEGSRDTLKSKTPRTEDGSRG